MTIWAGVPSDFLTGPYSRRKLENGILFGNIERMAQTSAQRQRNLTLGQSYTSLFLGTTFRTYVFPGRWFGRGWPTSLVPLTWPPRGPDLTTPDNSLWGSNEECHRVAEGVFRTNAPTQCYSGQGGSRAIVSNIRVHIRIQWNVTKK